MPKRSLVWNYFEKLKEGSSIKAICKQCSHEYILAKDGSTKTLLMHLRNIHELLKTDSNSSGTADETSEVPASATVCRKQRKITDMCIATGAFPQQAFLPRKDST